MAKDLCSRDYQRQRRGSYPADPDRICEYCSGSMDGKRARAKWCSKSCASAAWQDANREQYNANHRDWQDSHPEARMLQDAKLRANRFGVPFDLTAEDIVIPNVCPVLGVPLVRNLNEYAPDSASPTLDRIRPWLGYVRGNVHVVSMAANTKKSSYHLLR